ncbi:MAG: TIGR03086 family metal-binding protein [Actinomycetota bacterium]
MPTDDELRTALERAMVGFAELVTTLTDADLDRASMCDGWTIRDVIEHVVGGDRFAAIVLDSGTLADAIGAVMGVDHLAPDRDVSLADAAAAARSGFAESLDRLVDHPVGTVPARRFIGFRVLDQLGHTWDIAAALGQVTTLDPVAVQVGLEIVELEQDMLETSEHFSTPPGDPVTQDRQARFLQAIGRG